MCIEVLRYSYKVFIYVKKNPPKKIRDHWAKYYDDGDLLKITYRFFVSGTKRKQSTNATMFRAAYVVYS